MRAYIELVEHDDEGLVGDLADDKALSGLCLDAFADVDDENHHVDDLRSADDRPDQRRVPRAVHQSDLKLIVRLVR